MKIFISIVSHLHHDIIINLGTIKKLQNYANVQVVCRDNKPIDKLRHYCQKYGAIYLSNNKNKGFASNNNLNFLYCQKHLGMQSTDMFLLVNPDILIDNKELDALIIKLSKEPTKLATCNLYLDSEYIVHDDNIRLYPKFFNFVKTYLLNDRTTMVKRTTDFVVTEQHWASASFLIVQADLYQKLKGLDESYYMYCEDIDFCYRANLMGEQIRYFKDIQIVHYRRCYSKRFLSKYFFWHVCSVFRYSFTRKKQQAKKSCLYNN